MRALRDLALIVVIAVLCTWPGRSFAQNSDNDELKPQPQQPAAVRSESKGSNSYRLDFVLNEFVDGKKVNSRTYSISVRQNQMSKVRTGTRYPVPTQNAAGIPQFQYLDIGVNIDCHVVEAGNMLELYAVIDSSNLSWPDSTAPHSAAGQPFVSQVRSEINSSLRPGVLSTLSNVDDPASKRRFQFDVTATKLN